MALPDASPNVYPFTQFVLKITNRCDLKCDYCYVFEMADTSWRHRPALISPETLKLAADRIAEHVRTHRLDDVQIILHGGEPFLAGPAGIEAICTTLRSVIGANLDLRVQTNATRLTDRLLEVVRAQRIHVSVSLDGGRAAHDRHRRYADGRSSYALTSSAIERLRAAAPELFAGLLCTIDLANDPVEVYDDLLAFEPPVIDFLLPHGNWTDPPPGRSAGGGDAPYGEWLAAVFDRWYGRSPRRTGVRMLDSIVGLLLGGHSTVETVGLSPVRLIVIDSDGSLEQADTLKSAYDGAAATGLNIAGHPLDAALGHPDVLARQRGAAALCGTCRECALHPVCGGGLYAHRYRDDGSGFLNPSVYCPDLTHLVEHVRRRLVEDVAALAARP
jgi:uncharacterized protein